MKGISWQEIDTAAHSQGIQHVLRFVSLSKKAQKPFQTNKYNSKQEKFAEVKSNGLVCSCKTSSLMVHDIFIRKAQWNYS